MQLKLKSFEHALRMFMTQERTIKELSSVILEWEIYSNLLNLRTQDSVWSGTNSLGFFGYSLTNPHKCITLKRYRGNLELWKHRDTGNYLSLTDLKVCTV